MAPKTRARVLTFGTHSHADFRASDIQSHGLAGVEFTLGCLGRSLGEESAARCRLVPNALAAIAVAVADGASVEEAAEALTDAQVKPRLQAKTRSQRCHDPRRFLQCQPGLDDWRRWTCCAR